MKSLSVTLKYFKEPLYCYVSATFWLLCMGYAHLAAMSLTN